MARRPRVAMLNADAAASISGIPAATLERADRAGKQLLGGFIERAAHEQFRELASELQKTNVDLLREAINDLFGKYGKLPIA